MGSGAQAPLHADVDVNVAHEYALTRVNFREPEDSKLVVRMGIDRHNCFGGSCVAANAKMLAAVTAWRDAIKDMIPPVPRGLSESANEGSANVVDPDAIARNLNPGLPSRAAIAAARQAVGRCRTLLKNRESFILESTLAGHGALSLMRAAKRAGYRTLLVYVALGDPELHIERVRLRVSQGGHEANWLAMSRNLPWRAPVARLEHCFYLANALPTHALTLFQSRSLRWPMIVSSER